MPTFLASTFSKPFRGIALLAIAVLAGGGYLLANMLYHPTARMKDAWYIDEQSGRVALNPADAIVRPATEIPPLLNANKQPTIVRAIFVTCGDAKERHLAYLEKYTPKAQQAFAQIQSGADAPSPQFLFTTQAGHLIRLPAPGAPWVSINSAAGIAILTNLGCAGKQATYCPPQGR